MYIYAYIAIYISVALYLTYYEDLAHTVTEAEKSNICRWQTEDLGANSVSSRPVFKLNSQAEGVNSFLPWLFVRF